MPEGTRLHLTPCPLSSALPPYYCTLPAAGLYCGGRNDLAGQKMQAYMAANVANPRKQALYFRTFLTFACGGTSNSLFAGDGYTYTVRLLVLVVLLVPPSACC